MNQNQIPLHSKHAKQNTNQKIETRPRRKTIQQQFIEHCAIIIQTRFRGYLQRKRYRQFLPIYRRVRELLLAVYSGWKIRRIMKLAPIKAQISEIKAKVKSCQMSQVRIKKRELIDEVDRLSRKGRWIEVLWKNRNHNKSGWMEQSKQNCPLYMNIKSQSIKNIFKPPPTQLKTIKLTKAVKNKVETPRINEQQKQEVAQSRLIVETRHPSFDDIPLKPSKGFYSFDEGDCKISNESQNADFKKKAILRKSSKAKPQIVKPEVKKGQNIKIVHVPHIQIKVKQRSTTNTSDRTIKQDSKVTHTPLQESGVKSTQKQKIKMTVSKKPETPKANDMVASSKSQASQMKNSESRYVPNNSQLIMSKLLKSQQTVKNHEDIYSLMRVYNTTYAKKKQKILGKTVQLDLKFTPNMSQTYGKLIHQIKQISPTNN